MAQVTANWILTVVHLSLSSLFHLQTTQRLVWWNYSLADFSFLCIWRVRVCISASLSVCVCLCHFVSLCLSRFLSCVFWFVSLLPVFRVIMLCLLFCSFLLPVFLPPLLLRLGQWLFYLCSRSWSTVTEIILIIVIIIMIIIILTGNSYRGFFFLSDGVHRREEQTSLHVSWWNEDTQACVVASSLRWHPHAPWEVRLDAFVWLLQKRGAVAFCFLAIVMEKFRTKNMELSVTIFSSWTGVCFDLEPKMLLYNTLMALEHTVTFTRAAGVFAFWVNEEKEDLEHAFKALCCQSSVNLRF